MRFERIGRYDVTALLGEGGMGQVYRARDTKLDRDVALKVLPEAFTSDPDRLARFEREAKVLASLNHPYIGSIYGLEESEGVKGLVLELVEGPTLADRIAQGPIPIDEALPIARQIAEALEAAHEVGVIHRDLKPANIKVREDGTVKVLDFGLAKALDTRPEGDPSQSPTLTAAATQMGVIMGTAAYMSPEQARGKPVGRRADIWAFGAVLFEMLTGQGGLSHRLPWVLPGGEAVLFTVWNRSRTWSEAEVVVESLVTGERRVLVEGGANPIYVPSGHLLYVTLGALWAAPLDVTTPELTGPGVPVLEEVTQAAEISNVLHNTGAAQLSLSTSGGLVYVPGGLVLPDLRRLVWVDREGRQERADMPEGEYWWPRFSPGGEHFAVADAGDNSVIVFDRRRNLAQRLPGNGFSVGAWTPDGGRIFMSWAEDTSARNLFWQPADGSGPPERLTSSSRVQFPGSSLRDGELVFVEIHPDNGEDVLVLDPREPETTEKRLLGESFDEEYPALSPDGRWMAYASNESGESEVFVVAYPDLEGKYPISDGAGYMPTWSSDGREIYYLRPPSVVGEDTPLMAVSVSTDASFRAEPPRELFRFRHQPSNAARSYDVAPDGRFLMVESGTGPRSRAVTPPRVSSTFSPNSNASSPPTDVSATRHHPGFLFRHRQDRPGRHGRGLSGARDEARPRRGAGSFPRLRHGGSRALGSFRAGGCRSLATGQ